MKIKNFRKIKKYNYQIHIYINHLHRILEIEKDLIEM